ncbi:hypothetical protein AGDE_14459 [Angomonas deanei]|uniref:Uncharacterized protein n=1 Tax=Angomonas deanei TaxID=59799 RepID=A0A7G2CWG1_9TRYP|nr:hypothetical protein AGDE_14459 [Angomonas deanei]CAD2222763.1 hypothetical protein, conserved [Angomonas deanei]|eukprot:EPY20821.1 hypothetical protein AGDE_14459 [Angomonas deanei]
MIGSFFGSQATSTSNIPNFYSSNSSMTNLPRVVGLHTPTGQSYQPPAYYNQLKSPEEDPVRCASPVTPTDPNTTRAPVFFTQEYVIQPNAHYQGVINVFQVSPLIHYYEMQFGSVLKEGAVLFALLLRKKTGMDFPPYTLLVCPTVFALLEMWDGFEFVKNSCGV